MSDVFSSIFSAIDAFAFRCRNDADYTMEWLEGGAEGLTGYRNVDLLNNATVSYVGIMAPEDTAAAVARIDEAIEARRPWDLSYRIVHRDRSLRWVRERGRAVVDDAGELIYLEGLIVGADAEVALRKEVREMLNASRGAYQEITQLTQRIVDSVAQLNILSINARIEAARSGEAGQGFAIVAAEMNKLATANGEWAAIIAQKTKATEQFGLNRV
ncbi:MAG: PAS domain-containing protein [Pseudomonadota bacterium]